MSGGGRLKEGDFCLTEEFYIRKNYSHIRLWHGMFSEARTHSFNCLFRKHVLIISYKVYVAKSDQSCQCWISQLTKQRKLQELIE